MCAPSTPFHFARDFFERGCESDAEEQSTTASSECGKVRSDFLDDEKEEEARSEIVRAETLQRRRQEGHAYGNDRVEEVEDGFYVGRQLHLVDIRNLGGDHVEADSDLDLDLWGEGRVCINQALPETIREAAMPRQRLVQMLTIMLSY